MSESVAHDQIRAFIERIERLDEELKAINDDKKEIFAEAKGNGFDVPALKQVLKIRRQDENERLEREAIVELYMSALGMIATPDFDEPRVQVQARVREASKSATPEHDAETGEITEPQSPPSAARDLTVPPSPQGQVAPIQPETAVPSAEPERASASGDHEEAQADLIAATILQSHRAETPEGQGQSALCDEADADKSAGAPASVAPAPLYAAPGVVVMERVPPEGAIAHPYATCWPVRDLDVSEGVREPIVKIGKLILDGRGRMFAARGWNGGQGMEYPVVQYDGTDPLMDCIRWNLASRPGLHAHNLKMIAGKLSKLVPEREHDIYEAMGIAAEVAA